MSESRDLEQGGGRPLKLSDLRLLKRLFPLARPLWLMLAAGCLLILAKAAVDLTGPYLTKLAVDNHIAPAALKLTRPPAEAPENIQAVWAALAPDLIASGDGQTFFLPSGRKKILDARQKRQLLEAGFLERAEYYLARSESASAQEAARLHPAEVKAYPSLMAINTADLPRLSKKTLLAIRAEDLSGLAFLAGLCAGLVALGYIFDFGQRVFLEVAAQRFSHQLRQGVTAHVLNQRLSFYDHQKVGVLVSRLTSDVQNLADMVKSFASTFFSDLFLLFGITGVMFYLSPRLALLTLALTPLIFWLSRYFGRLSRNVQRRLRKKLAEINHTFSETLNGLAVIQAFGREKHNGEIFGQLNQANYLAGIDQVKIMAVFLPLVDFFASLTLAIIVWFGGLAVIDDKLTLGVVAAFVGYSRQFFMPIRDLAEKNTILQAAAVSLERLIHLLETNETLPRNPHPPDIVGRGEVEFQKVDFAYNHGQLVLQGINFKVTPGQVLALVGATGSGKSSIINLLLRFYDPQKGRVLVDGQDLRDLDPTAHRRRIGLVAQEVYLHSGSVMANLKLGRPQVTDEAAIRAAEMVGASRFIEQLPQGYHEPLGAGGRSLSAGQRQLLSCARALIQAPQMVIFDEATAFVDSEAERLIEAALDELFAGRTAIIIAHRLSTVRRADRILVLNQGRVVEDGHHRELMDLKGFYHQLAVLQNLS